MTTTPTWWVMDEESFREALDRVAAGNDPELVYMECYANAFIHPASCGCEECEE